MAQPEPLSPLAPEPLATRGYDFGPFRVDLASYQLLKDGSPVDLTSKVFDTLVYLLKQRHRVVTKEELLSAVWRDAAVTDDSLVQCISALRRAIGDDATKQAFVTTVARRGYKFVAPATEWIEAVEPPPALAPSAHPPAAQPPNGASAAPSLATMPSPAVAASSASPRRQVSLVWAVPAALLLVGLGWYLGTRYTTANPRLAASERTLRFSQEPPPETSFTSGGALSPNAGFLAFTAEDSATGRNHLWIRPLDAATPRRIDGTDGATRPFWSPDSRFIGFIAGGRLKTVSVDGGAPTDVATVGLLPSGAAWSPRGQIIFSTWGSGFSSVSASGGTIAALTTLADGELTHAWPQFLPDGDHFLYSIYGRQGGVYVGSLSSSQRTQILTADPGALYSPLGYLVFMRNGVLTAQAFDPASLSLSGETFNVVGGNVEGPSMTNGTMLSAAGGLLAMGGARGDSELVWFDRSGRRLSTLTTPAPLHNPVLSTDETRVFANTFPPSQSAVWAVDLERGATSRLVPDAGVPVPAPDGRTLAYSAGSGIFTVDLNRSANEPGTALVPAGNRKIPIQFTPDGQYLLYHAATGSQQDLWLMPLGSDRTARPVFTNPANEIQGRVSPDGRWIAYASDESGRWEVYVQSFPDAKSKVTISTDGGAEPIWRPDGRELYYLAQDHSLMAVDVTPGARLGLGRPRRLFRPRVLGEPATYRSHYTVTADGERFLVDVLSDPTLDPVTMLLNWAPPGR